MFEHALIRTCLLTALLWLLCAVCACGETAFYVSPSGRDTSPGTKSAPFATLAKARDAVRIAKDRPGVGAVRVYLRGGVYYLHEPLVLTPLDSGTAQRPIEWLAYPGEKPIICGGVAVSGWHKASGKLWTARVPEAIGGKDGFTQLFAGGQRQIRARYPDFDSKAPLTGGFLFARQPKHWEGDFGSRVGSIHNAGDFLEYEINVPVDGQYLYWLYYGSFNKPFGSETMNGNTQVSVDGGTPVPLVNLPDTGAWDAFAWANCAKLDLTAGRHTLRWTNAKGGGLNLDAFILCDDPQWKPVGTENLTPPPGKHIIITQCEAFTKANGKQMTTDGFVEKTGTKLYFDKGKLHAWPQSPDKELHIFVYEGGLCSNAIVPVTNIDENQSLLTMAYPPGGYRAELGARFFLENVREALDSPGEWFLDRVTGILTYWPVNPKFNKTPTVLSCVDRLIELRSNSNEPPVQFVGFEGLSFECTDFTRQRQDWYHSDDSAIWFRAAQHCRVKNCSFTNLGGSGIVMAGNCTDNKILSCKFGYLGAGAVTINGNPGNQHLAIAEPGKPAEHNTVAGNTIHNTGLIFKHGNPICLNSAENNTISHNTIRDHPRQGIVLTEKCGGNVIEYNELRHNCLETGDSGGIYTYDTNKLPTPNIIRGNLVVDCRGMCTTQEGKIVTPTYTWGIYIDGESSNWIVQDNVVIGNVLGGVFINGGHNNVIENNILLNGLQAQIAYSDYAQHGVDNVFKHNIVMWGDPKVNLLWSRDWIKDTKHIDADNNLYWNAGKAIPELVDLQKAGLDNNSKIANPLFMNPAKEDFRLRPTSPALQLGIKSIDLTKVGAKGWKPEN